MTPHQILAQFYLTPCDPNLHSLIRSFARCAELPNSPTRHIPQKDLHLLWFFFTRLAHWFF